MGRNIAVCGEISMSGITDKIYQISPTPIQQCMVAIYGYGWYHRRFSKYFHQLVNEYRTRESWNQDQFLQYQELQLLKVLKTALNSPYYRQVFQEAGISGNIAPLEALRHLPFLNKETLRTRPKDLLTQQKLPQGVIVHKSSGTTGTSTHIYYTREFHALELAVAEARNLHWAGANYKDRRVMFGVRKVCNYDQSKPPFWRFSPAENMAYASIYHLSKNNLPYYIDFLRQYRPAIIMGYPSALFTIASYALENNDLPAPVKAIFTMSETLEHRARNTIESAWQSRIWDRYGAVEGCVFASQCEFGRYHVSPEIGLVEILDRNGNSCPPGDIGEVICTGLQNTLQPLIRYRIGDMARWAENQNCPCDRHMPILEGIEGRFEDICITPDGREILRFDTVFKGVDTIKEAQIVQERLDLFIIYVVPGLNFGPADIDILKKNMRMHVGDVQTKIEIVSNIPRSQSGKFRAVISKLNQMRDPRVE